MIDIKKILNKVVDNVDLSTKEMEEVFNDIMEGEATQAQIGSFITALRMKGETILEITGAAKIMRKFATKIRLSSKDNVIDTCGTGGDNSHTFNISTAAAIVVAACGVPVAKHGNRSVSSACGSADVLSKLGVNIEIPPEKVEECIEKTNIGFLFAPMLHGAMQYAIGPRRELGIRTIFNILGPLTNPAGAKRQLLGVFDKKWVKPLAATLKNLGSDKVMIVHGFDGLDEITITGKTYVCELSKGELKEYEIDPRDYGLSCAVAEDLKGGGIEDNAKIIQDIFDGQSGAKRDVVLLNSAAALYVADKADGIKEGIEIAAEAIDKGFAKNKLEELVKVSNS